MGTISTYDQAVAAIENRSARDRGFISDPFAGDVAARRGLLRTQALLDQLGQPDRAYPIVHVAGSKGKGSTCAFVDAILRASGRTSGRHLSPHLHSWRERIVVNDEMVPDEVFVALARDAVAAAEAIEAAEPAFGTVTAFELTVAMALLGFARAGCDIAVVEVGLGGTLDATNVITPAVSVITPLDYEHTATLGETMTEIAGNKAGIIKQGRPVVCAAQPDEGLAVIEARATACDSRLLLAGRDFTATGTDRGFTATGPWGAFDELGTGMIGQHQVENAALAIAAVHALEWNDMDAEAIRTGLRSARLPGRFEQVDLDTGQTVIIDGAHTPRAASALATALRDRFPDIPPTIAIGMLRDKDPAGVLAPLAAIAGRWIATSPNSVRAFSAAEVAAALDALGAHVTSAPSVDRAVAMALSAGSPLVVVTGSLTTVAEARVALNLA